jgi:ElaB/YqjD/DUF883 family membrane-anchored ribosome-binding protein
MTDAAVPITQSVVEQFTERYLKTLDCKIEKFEDRWRIMVPDRAATELATGQITLYTDKSASERDDAQYFLHPESSFFQTFITEASERSTTGKIAVTLEDSKIEIPSWLRESSVDVVDSTFSPYYDRTAAAVLYRIRIETVSEYQTELLRAIAIDVRSEDRLAALEETVLDITNPEDPSNEADSLELGRDQSKRIIDQTRGEIIDVVDQTIDEIHQEASRAADAELEEFRQMQEQRIEELQGQRSDLTSKIDDLSNSIPQAAGQRDRVDDLKTRKDLKSDLNEIDTELEDLRRCREQGFPSKQHEIRDRHALEVVVTPLTITEVQYDRGEAYFKLMDDSTSVDITLGYGNGVGITEDIHCDRCGEELTGRNPVFSLKDGIRCEYCSRSS